MSKLPTGLRGSLGRQQSRRKSKLPTLGFAHAYPSAAPKFIGSPDAKPISCTLASAVPMYVETDDVSEVMTYVRTPDVDWFRVYF
jgi:hypothetical protein